MKTETKQNEIKVYKFLDVRHINNVTLVSERNNIFFVQDEKNKFILLVYLNKAQKNDS